MIRDAFPLQWPMGWPRTDNHRRERARFGRMNDRGGRAETTFQHSTSLLFQELERLGAKSVVLSSNLQLRNDGFPYANQRRPEDPGIAVYFLLDGAEQCVPCDKWDRPEDNIKAIAKTVEALRGIERWGAKEMVKAAFKGFTAIGYDPGTENKIVPPIQYFSGYDAAADLKARYRDLVKKMHPDAGGDEKEFAEMSRQYEEKKQRIGGGQ